MKKNKILVFVLLFVFILYAFQPSSFATDLLNETDAPPEPEPLAITAKSAFLLDADTGDVLFNQNGDTQIYPASTTKIMTAYLTLKYGNIQDAVTLGPEVFSGMDEASSTAGLSTGEIVTVYQLIQCMMIVSANEAANALAIYISGTIEEFVSLMNTEAEALGCTGTHFSNPNGLHDENHYTTANDLAIIAQAAIQNDTFRQICSTASTTMGETNLSDSRILENTNYLLPGTAHTEWDYATCWGIKTGYTTPAGYCLVSVATWNNITLLGVVMGAEKQGDGDDATICSFTDSASLLTWGFENYTTAVNYQKYLATLTPPVIDPAESKILSDIDDEDIFFDSTQAGSDPDSAVSDDRSAETQTAVNSTTSSSEEEFETSVLEYQDTATCNNAEISDSDTPSISIPEPVIISQSSSYYDATALDVSSQALDHTKASIIPSEFDIILLIILLSAAGIFGTLLLILIILVRRKHGGN